MSQYSHYFDIDPDYFPAVNEAVIKKHPDVWMKFYPHESFVKLINATLAILEDRSNVSLWVEGAYGTGKSHAVLTLKKLLDASESDTRAYFSKYESILTTDKCNQFVTAKAQKRLLTVHRYGSSDIYGDRQLVAAIQESVLQALKEAGMEDTGRSALKTAIIDWLDNPAKKRFLTLLSLTHTVTASVAITWKNYLSTCRPIKANLC